MCCSLLCISHQELSSPTTCCFWVPAGSPVPHVTPEAGQVPACASTDCKVFYLGLQFRLANLKNTVLLQHFCWANILAQYVISMSVLWTATSSERKALTWNFSVTFVKHVLSYHIHYELQLLRHLRGKEPAKEFELGQEWSLLPTGIKHQLSWDISFGPVGLCADIAM